MFDVNNLSFRKKADKFSNGIILRGAVSKDCPLSSFQFLGAEETRSTNSSSTEKPIKVEPTKGYSNDTRGTLGGSTKYHYTAQTL